MSVRCSGNRRVDDGGVRQRDISSCASWTASSGERAMSTPTTIRGAQLGRFELRWATGVVAHLKIFALSEASPLTGVSTRKSPSLPENLAFEASRDF
jgi:hypothetical protein